MDLLQFFEIFSNSIIDQELFFIMNNKAAWLSEKKAHPFKVDDAPIPELRDREVLIRVRAVAINPCDYGIQQLGIIWTQYPLIIGSDIAGDVVSIGSAVTKFSKGDRVIAVVETGGFQLFSAADMALVARLPDQTSYTDGCVLPLGITTAASSLFEKENLALQHPQLIKNPKSTGKLVIVWGGSSCVGSCGIQMAKAAGYEVAATCSNPNMDHCKGLGADYVFDYKRENIVDEIVTALKGKDNAGIFSAIMAPEVLTKCAQIADRMGGNKLVGTVVPPQMDMGVQLPEGVKLGVCPAIANVHPNSLLIAQLGWELLGPTSQLEPAVWSDWLTVALGNGTLKPKPDAFVVGKGLEKIQEAVDLMGKGVSARKLVVELE